jgi:hypothetical protein
MTTGYEGAVPRRKVRVYSSQVVLFATTRTVAEFASRSCRHATDVREGQKAVSEVVAARE